MIRFRMVREIKVKNFLSFFMIKFLTRLNISR